MDESSSCSTAVLNSDTTVTLGSRQSTASSRLSRFDRYNLDDVPVKRISFELGQVVGYQGFLGVTVRRISPPEQGFQAVVINIPGVGDKQLSMVDLANEDYLAQRSAKKLQMHGMSKEEKLQAKVCEFTSKAVRGMRVDLVDVETRLLSESLLILDRHMTTLSLRLAFGDEQTFRIKDLRSLAKGEQFEEMVPKLSHLASQCLAMEFASDPRLFQVFFFKDSDERDDFHQIMKVVRAVASSGQN